MIRPGPRLVRALGAVALAALLVPLLVPLVPVLARPLAWALAAALAVLLAIAGREALALRRLRVHARWPEAVVLPLDEDEEIPLEVSTRAARPVRLTVRQTWPDLLLQTAAERHEVCRPGEVLSLSLPVRAVARGSARLSLPWTSATFGGWAERIAVAEHPERSGQSTELTVLPNLRAVRRLRGQLDRLFLHGFGNRAAPSLGKGRDFDRLREYVIGDDLRDVAWKASARHRKLITREYRLDRSQDIVICLDRGHRMAARVSHITRLDHAVNAAVLLASICNRMEDRVGLLSFADVVEQGLGQGRGGGHLRKLTAFAAGVMPEYRHTDYLALAAHLRRRLHSRALVLFLTTLPELEAEDTVVRAVDLLVPQHLPVVIAFTDPALNAAAQLLPADKQELCRTLVARDLWTERRRVLGELRRRGALVVETAPGDAGIEAVNSYLEVKRRQLL